MAQLDIAEKRLPQDGRITLRVAGKPIDVRVSTIPTGHGERVVLRLLDKQAGRLDLTNLGMDDATLAHMDRLIREPHGIVLVTGPTGSGKTTTLYAALSRLDATALNIMTVEDPIEYDLDGISQTQVNTRIDMSFARALRTILRQDPDVGMIGEIRDLETAQIAVQAICAVSRSRISPIMTTSGSWRRMVRSARAKLISIRVLTWVWLMPSRSYSIGSSTVMMLSAVASSRDNAA